MSICWGILQQWFGFERGVSIEGFSSEIFKFVLFRYENQEKHDSEKQISELFEMMVLW